MLSYFYVLKLNFSYEIKFQIQNEEIRKMKKIRVLVNTILHIQLNTLENTKNIEHILPAKNANQISDVWSFGNFFKTSGHQPVSYCHVSNCILVHDLSSLHLSLPLFCSLKSFPLFHQLLLLFRPCVFEVVFQWFQFWHFRLWTNENISKMFQRLQGKNNWLIDAFFFINGISGCELTKKLHFLTFPVRNHQNYNHTTR